MPNDHNRTGRLPPLYVRSNRSLAPVLIAVNGVQAVDIAPD